VSEILPDFIEIGIDGINPVQYTAKGMEAERLKKEFGKNLGFFGGGIENEILSYGSIAQIKQDAQHQIVALAPGGGYLFATIHNISPEVPPENVEAFFQIGLEYGRFPVQS
jgi:uroporphyrinogen decarboxylase